MKKLLSMYDRVFDFWVTFPQFVRYLLVGGFNTVVFYLLFVFFVLHFGEAYAQRSLFIAFVLSTFSSYFTQRTFVFLSHGDLKKEYFKCAIVWVGGYFLNAVLLEVFTRKIGFNAYVSGLLAILITTVLTYFLLKYFAFGKRKGTK